MSGEITGAQSQPFVAAPSQTSPEDEGGVQILAAPVDASEDATGQTAADAETQSDSRQRRKRPKCRFFATKKGCRFGDNCPFLHDLQSAPVKSIETSAVDGQTKDLTSPILTSSERKDALPVEPQQETPAQRDPNTFQLNQIIRRFRAKQESSDNDMILLKFSMPPSDPDFPFDIDALECTLKIPTIFPKGRPPTLRVTNKEMERGYQINVERGFDAIWAQAANPTLLNAMKVLDKRLEVLLTAQKAEIVKLVANTGSSILPPAEKTEAMIKDPGEQLAASSSKTVQNPIVPAQPAVSAEGKLRAKKKREAEVQILEHRLGRSPQFEKAADGTLFTVPIEPRKRSDLPKSLQAVKAVHLLVPLEYDIDPCNIQLLGVEGQAAEDVSKAFLKHVLEHPEGTLLAHVNYLAQNIHTMAAELKKDPVRVDSNLNPAKPHDSIDNNAKSVIRENDDQIVKDTDREHVKIIQRPPEWDTNPEQDEEESTDGYDSEYDTSEEEDEDQTTEEAPDNAPSAPREKGVLISLPDLELHSIELLELVIVNVTVKCERCKDTLDVSRIKPHSEDNQVPTSTSPEVHFVSCKKCANPFSIGYRKDIMHANSIRAGYLDLEGCTIVDLLPSTFLPTCSDCSTPASANGGVVSVRGESSLTICRSCHRKMTFRIREVKFLNIGPSSLHSLPLRASRKPKKESLGIVAGTPLPNRGRCTHYSKSYRWFRFSCCNAVYPCDKCHDKETDHPNEFANRMICGWCSREQHYRPEDCSHCKKNVTGRTGSGFWEGGKGTRDRARMSRKDPRKYKRRGGGAIAARSK